MYPYVNLFYKLILNYIIIIIIILTFGGSLLHPGLFSRKGMNFSKRGVQKPSSLMQVF